MHGFQDTFQPVERADRRQDVGRIGPLGATGFDPALRFAGGQERIEEPLAGLMGQQAAVKIVQQCEVKAGVRQVCSPGATITWTMVDPRTVYTDLNGLFCKGLKEPYMDLQD
jgi:hypothetical protein